MITVTHKIPREVTLAFSGGIDSVAVADFLKRNHKLSLLFVHHNTKDSDKAYNFVQRFAADNCLPINTHYITNTKPTNQSQEEFWRNERYAVFEQQRGTVVTCHHLDDCVETWVWSSMHGCGKLIPATRANIIRPFLTTRKQQFIDWCTSKALSWCEDESNTDTKFMRNYIRHKVMPHVLHLNPGIHKTIRKKIIENV